MKKTLVIIIGILAIILVASLAKDAIIKVSVEKSVEVVTGLKLSIADFKTGVLRSLVHIRELKIFNPSGYEDKTMLDMPEIYVRYDLPAVIGGKIHLPEVRIHMKEFVVVKNAKGDLNLNSLKVVQAQKEGKEPSEEAGGKPLAIQIDSLELKIGKVLYKDYSRGGAPSVQEFDVNIDEKYSNITNPYSIASLIVVKALMNTSIARLANFDLKGLQGTIGDTLGSAQKVAAEAVTKAQAQVTKTQAQVTKAMASAGVDSRQAQETVKKTAESLQGMLKNPFGAKDR